MNSNRIGLLFRIKTLLHRNRLGELMVMTGILTAGELKYALARQKTSGDHLGRVLLRERMVSRQALYRLLAQQWTLRCFAAFLTVFIAFSSFGVKPARAGTIRDVPAEMSIVHSANTAFAPVRSYPALFGYGEKRSENLGAFVKWSGMFNRFEAALHDPASQRILTAWTNQIRPYANRNIIEMAEGVNDIINQQQYVNDDSNWGVSDYWETPVEFFKRGGDCEDFAIAKYVSLRVLGVPEDRMRIAIVHDERKNMPHAVLVVYSEQGPLILDNQVKEVRFAQSVNYYRPIFTINRTAWWLHTAPGATVLASAR